MRLLFISAIFCLVTSSLFAEGRTALVIGNSDYDNADFLPNATNDARGVADALTGLGFDVFVGYDLTQREMLALALDMQSNIDPDGVALFFFAGHGLQMGGQNFMLPVDAFGANPEMLQDSSVKLQTILSDISRLAERTVAILDACRNNPFEVDAATRSAFGPSRGLAEVDAGINSFIAFSTEPGNVAFDGVGDNSPFTAALLQYLSEDTADLHAVMRSVRKDVYDETSGLQVPWENSAMLDLVYLSEPFGRRQSETPIAVNQPVPPTNYTYQVAGLNPAGDGFLALRSGSTTNASMISRMVEGTKLEFLGQNGVWFHVRTETGLQGWAHSNWIHFVGRQAASVPAPQTCGDLWYARNEIFARNGYCFQGARGQAAFSNEGCRRGVAAGDIGLTRDERDQVAQLVAREKAMQCQ